MRDRIRSKLFQGAYGGAHSVVEREIEESLQRTIKNGMWPEDPLDVLNTVLLEIKQLF